MIEGLTRLLYGYWWARGIAAALGFLVLVKQLFGLEYFEAAGAIIATIISWEQVLGWLGALIGYLPFLPKLSSHQVLCLSLILTFSLPASIKAIDDLGSLLDQTRRAQKRGEIRKELAKIEASSRGPLDLRTRSGRRKRTLEFELNRLEAQVSLSTIIMRTVLLLAAGTSLGYLVAYLIAPTAMSAKATSIGIVFAVAIAFALACRLRGFVIGAVTVITFLITVELMYLGNTPSVAEFVRKKAATASHMPINHER